MLKRFWLWLTGETRNRRMVEEFARKFPGKCMICSMHRFGRNNGYEQKPEPAAHDCIERRAALKAVGEK